VLVAAGCELELGVAVVSVAAALCSPPLPQEKLQKASPHHSFLWQSSPQNVFAAAAAVVAVACHFLQASWVEETHAPPPSFSRLVVSPVVDADTALAAPAAFAAAAASAASPVADAAAAGVLRGILWTEKKSTNDDLIP